MAQVGPAARSVLRQSPAALWQAHKIAQEKAEIPQWLKDAERLSEPSSESVQKEASAEPADQAAVADVSRNRTVDGARWKLFVGAPIPLYSSSKQESELRNMHEPNHRELRIAKVAARVADFLWPKCQDDIDEALAKAKEMQARKRVHEEEEEIYEPPKVPHVLPITSWVRNSKEMRESFICDESTRYKPRMAWYNPNDGMVPSGWLTEGLLADLAYYKPFVGLRKPDQKW